MTRRHLPQGQMRDPLAFDLLGPLPAPRSTTVLEASAGTGTPKPQI